MRRNFSRTVAVTGSLLLISSAISQDGARGELRGRLREAVLEAKASGRSQVRIPAVQITPASVNSLFTIRESYTVVVAQPQQIVMAPTADGNGITTWYKLKVSEMVTKQPVVSSEPSLGQLEVPAGLLPIGPDEVLMAMSGGSIVAQGVTVLQGSPFNLRLEPNREYVLCLYLQWSGALADLASLSDGAFELQPDGSTILPLGHKEHPLVRDVYVRTGNSLEFLRQALQEQRR